jgi:SAM-dependent methyltransferase
VKISPDDIQIHASSYVDPNGFVFLYEDQFHRAILQKNEKFYRSLFANGTVEELSNKYNLVESQPTDLSLPELDSSFIICHEKIKPLTFCVEWCPSMLKQAALTTLELAIALDEEDCLLQDAYPWNILFDSTNPVHVDFTSIVPSDGVNLLWPAYQQFMNFFLHPLKLAAMGKGHVARLLLNNYINGISLEELNREKTLVHVLKHPFESIAGSVMGFIEKRAQGVEKIRVGLQKQIDSPTMNENIKPLRRRMLKRLLKKTQGISLPSAADNWTRYYEEITGVSKNKKEAIVESILMKAQPRSVLDLGCNMGRYSIIASQLKAKVIAMDSSESCIEALYKKARSSSLSITPVMGDIINPTPAFGFLARQFPSMIDRFKSDTVLCLALMHHLHIVGRQSFDRIAKLMNELSTRMVIFEFVALNDDNNHLINHGRIIDYSLDTVSQELSKYFKLTYFDSDRETRRIILCEK